MAIVDVSDASLKRIIVDGDPEELIKQAEKVGGVLSKSLKTSQIRTIFGSVRQIQMNWPPEPKDRSNLEPDDLKKLQEAADKGWRQLLLLIPKLRYQGTRIKEAKPLVGVLEPAIRLVDKDRGYFQNFAEFFEAILAYHTAAGGKS